MIFCVFFSLFFPNVLVTSICQGSCKQGQVIADTFYLSFWEQIVGKHLEDESGTHVACAQQSDEICFVLFYLSFWHTEDEGDASHLHTEIQGAESCLLFCPAMEWKTFRPWSHDTYGQNLHRSSLIINPPKSFDIFRQGVLADAHILSTFQAQGGLRLHPWRNGRATWKRFFRPRR